MSGRVRLGRMNFECHAELIFSDGEVQGVTFSQEFDNLRDFEAALPELFEHLRPLAKRGGIAEGAYRDRG